jgi:hypothetical protein
VIRQARAYLADANRQRADPYARYRDQPAAFARDVLGFRFTSAQEQMAESLLVPPYRTLVPSANEQGKTAGAAAVVLWWYRTRSPAIVRTTAPKFEQVKDLLWKEIRRLARKLNPPLPFQPKACRIERAEDDYAVGTTSSTETGAQGHHGPNQLFVMDEATGIEGLFFTATESMFSPPGHAWLVIFNPTTTSSQVYIEYSSVESARRKDRSPPWHIVRMSALDHPNIAAELAGLDPPVPNAMRVGKLERLLLQWSTLTGADTRKAYCEGGGPEPGDVVWPPVDAVEYCRRTGQEPRVYRPGPEAQARLLARFPDQSATGVWGDGDWLSACRELPGQEQIPEPEGYGLPLPEIGCDVARFGDDLSETHARCGSVSLHHEIAAKRPVDQTAVRLIELARWLADWYNRRKEHLAPRLQDHQVPIKIDDDGVGGGVSDILIGKGYTVQRVSAQSNANDSEHYPDRRSELWFVTAERARRGDLDLSRLHPDTRDELRRQALTATWKMDADARRTVEPKDKIKERLKRSPDGIDALNLAYYTVGSHGPGIITTTIRNIPTRGGWGSA